MGERRFRTSSISRPPRPRKMASPDISSLTTMHRSTSTGSATIARCPTATLSRLRSLHRAEWITLFTPFVPHPPSTLLARDMDPFEPLGRSLPRQVRHVPYRLDNGMTETHADFLPSSGAILIVICSTENVLSQNPNAYEQQTKFARDILQKIEENKTLSGVPVFVLLITNGAERRVHESGVREFPALLTVNNYTTSALENAVRVMFGN